jgi:hypothetical protein
MMKHHESCACTICRPKNQNKTSGAIRAEVEVSVNLRVEVYFEDNGVTCIEDQAADHARDKLGLALHQDMDVLRVRCFANPFKIES